MNVGKRVADCERRVCEWELKFPMPSHGKRAFAHSKVRCVVGFEIDGDGIVRHPSIADAALAMVERGITQRIETAKFAISRACNGHRRSAFGYIWRHDWERSGLLPDGGRKRVRDWEESLTALSYRKRMLKRLVSRPIIGFEIGGDAVLRYPSLKEAARDFVRRGVARYSVAAASICGAATGHRHSALGYDWRFDWESVPVPPEGVRGGWDRKAVIGRAVAGTDSRTYGSVTAAAKDLIARGLSRGCVSRIVGRICNCCNAKPSFDTVAGYRWAYVHPRD